MKDYQVFFQRKPNVQQWWASLFLYLPTGITKSMIVRYSNPKKWEKSYKRIILMIQHFQSSPYKSVITRKQKCNKLFSKYSSSFKIYPHENSSRFNSLRTYFYKWMISYLFFFFKFWLPRSTKKNRSLGVDINFSILNDSKTLKFEYNLS